MAMFHHIDNVFIKGTNFQQLVDFYSINFNLPVEYNFGSIQKLQIGSGVSNAKLTIVDGNSLGPAELPVLSLNVPNIQEAFAFVQTLGVPCDTYIRSIGPNNEYKHFEFRDIAGNLVTVTECAETSGTPAT